MRKLVSVLLITVLLTSIFLACANQTAEKPSDIVNFTSYLDIPGITQDEIDEIEKLKLKYGYFTYGMIPSTESFYDRFGYIQGFSPLVCEWLTKLFGISFMPRNFTRGELMSGLENQTIDFSGHLMYTEDRLDTYYMTTPIARRSVKYFRLKDSEPLSEIRENRLPRYALIKDAITTQNVFRYAIHDFEPVYIVEYIEGYDLLKSGRADALVTVDIAENVFEEFGDIETKYFEPMLYATASIATQNPELEVFINVIQKALGSGADRYLSELLRQSQRDYVRHKLFLQFDSAELAFLEENRVIPLAAEYNNYPVSFYSERYNDWRGIAFDVLKEVELLTGLKFVPVNEPETQWPELFRLLESGEALMVTELVRTAERENRFLWAEKSIMADRSMLISKSDFPNITFSEVYAVKVGLARETAHSDYFNRLYPSHQNTIEYEGVSHALNALTLGEVDMVMHRGAGLLRLTHYQELTGYKSNVIFENAFESVFGFNMGASELCSIINKTMNVIDVDTISEQWLNRTYDYQVQVVAAQRPWIIGVIGSLVFILILVFILFQRSRNEEKRLEAVVKERTAELKVAVEEAEAANKAKSAFLSTVSHEIRTPMNAILGITEIQLDKTNLDTDTRDALGKIFVSGDMLLGIINDLLDSSKMEVGKLELNVSDYEVEYAITDTAQLTVMRIASKPIEFELNIDENLPVYLRGDELRIKQILNNLLSNAFKYTDSGKVTLSISVEPSDEDSIILIFTVSDTGQGMTKEQVDMLFDEYARFNMEANRTTEGTGLGMSITKRLVGLMGGGIEVESEPGIGSTFTVRIPQSRAMSLEGGVLGKELAEDLRHFRTSRKAHMKRSQITREPMPYGKVLIVDDVDTNIYVAKGLLTPYKLEIDSADSGFKAIDKIRAGNTYDIIFMDHMMPEMDGIETVKIIRGMGYGYPIVALSADAVAGKVERFLMNGFNDFISKPIDIRHLNGILNKLIRDKQPTEVIEAARREANLLAEWEKNTETDKILTGIEGKVIEGLDIEKGLSKYAGAEKTYIKILESYVASNRSLLKAIDTVNEANLPDYRIAVHSIKGTSFSIFADEIGVKAKELEVAADAVDLTFINEQHPLFLEKVWKLVNDLEVILKEIEDNNPKPLKAKPDEAVLRELCEACKVFSMNGVNAAMEKIDEFEYNADDGLVEWLKEKVKLMKFMEIVEKLS